MRKGAIILFKDGYCYQSYGWKLLRPLGKLQNVLDHLEEYQVDEISIIRPVRDVDTDRAFYSDLNILSKLKTSTPLSFGGGLHNIIRVNDSKSLPFERLVFSGQLFLENNSLIEESAKLLGRQAIIGCLPFNFIGKKLVIFNAKKNEFCAFEDLNRNQLDLCDELLIYDTANEGSKNLFNSAVFDNNYLQTRKLIVSGGIFSKKNLEAPSLNIASVLIENRVLHKEYSIKR